MARADRDAAHVEDLRHVVRMDVVDIERHDPCPPLGSLILCSEIAAKSPPSACPSTVRCGADCAASSTKMPPCSCAQAASFSTGLIVPSEFDTWFVATTLTLPFAAIASSDDRSSS